MIKELLRGDPVSHNYYKKHRLFAKYEFSDFTGVNVPYDGWRNTFYLCDIAFGNNWWWYDTGDSLVIYFTTKEDALMFKLMANKTV